MVPPEITRAALETLDEDAEIAIERISLLNWQSRVTGDLGFFRRPLQKPIVAILPILDIHHYLACRPSLPNVTV